MNQLSIHPTGFRITHDGLLILRLFRALPKVILFVVTS